MNEEYNEVSSCATSPHGSVDVFAFSVSLFDETELRARFEDLDNLMLVDVMLLRELLEHLFEPDEAGDPHFAILADEVKSAKNFPPSG